MRTSDFYMADEFDRGATIYFCSPNAGDEATRVRGVSAANTVSLNDNWNSIDTSAQATSSTSYVTASDSLCSTIDCLSSSMEKTTIDIKTLVNSIKELGKRMGIAINDSGVIVSKIAEKGKMNLNYGVERRLTRADLKTLKERLEF